MNIIVIHLMKQMGRNYISGNEYKKYGKYSHSSCFKKYGSWDALLKAAGLQPTPFRNGSKSYSNEELFEEIERAWILLGRQPKYEEARTIGLFKISADTFSNHFGGWRKALEAFVAYINSDDESEDAPNRSHRRE